MRWEVAQVKDGQQLVKRGAEEVGLGGGTLSNKALALWGAGSLWFCWDTPAQAETGLQIQSSS